MTLTKILKSSGSLMQPCLSIMTGVGDVVLRQPLMVLSVNGSGSTAADPSRRGASIWLREPNISFANAGAAYPCDTHGRPNNRPALAKAAAGRMAADSKRHTHVARSGSTRQLGRSETALFACRNSLRCGACTIKARSAHRFGALLRSSLCKRAICGSIVSPMDERGSTQQYRYVCLRQPA